MSAVPREGDTRSVDAESYEAGYVEGRLKGVTETREPAFWDGVKSERQRVMELLDNQRQGYEPDYESGWYSRKALERAIQTVGEGSV